MRLSAAVLAAAALAISATTNNIGGVEAKRLRKVQPSKRGSEGGIAKGADDELTSSNFLDDAAAAEEDAAYWDRYLQADMESIRPTRPPTTRRPTNPPPTPAPPTNSPPTNPPPTNRPPTNPPPTNPQPGPPTNPPPTFRPPTNSPPSNPPPTFRPPTFRPPTNPPPTNPPPTNPPPTNLPPTNPPPTNPPPPPDSQCRTDTNTCGPGIECENGFCCSQWGWCGSSAAHCGECCQSNCWSS